MGIVSIITYLCVVVFVVSVVTRFVKLSTLPVHLRWEVYPVPHEKGKGHYGGSYLEEYEWWTKKRETSKLAELKVMIPEIILLAGVWEHNKKHWFRTFPFHFGLYLLGGLIALLAVGGVAGHVDDLGRHIHTGIIHLCPPFAQPLVKIRKTATHIKDALSLQIANPSQHLEAAQLGFAAPPPQGLYIEPVFRSRRRIDRRVVFVVTLPCLFLLIHVSLDVVASLLVLARQKWPLGHAPESCSVNPALQNARWPLGLE